MLTGLGGPFLTRSTPAGKSTMGRKPQYDVTVRDYITDATNGGRPDFLLNMGLEAFEARKGGFLYVHTGALYRFSMTPGNEVQTAKYICCPRLHSIFLAHIS